MVFNILKDGQTILTASDTEFEQWMKQAFATRLANFENKLLCYSPTAYPYKIPNHSQSTPHNFLSLSITGTSCSLNCEHCKGQLLKGMESTSTPESLFNRCKEIKDLGGEGVLISGGSISTGHVPLERFGETIRRVKKELDLLVVVHTGLVTPETARHLSEAGIDAAMLDIIGDTTVSENVYHIPDGPSKMRLSLDILEAHKVPTVPHVIVGLDYGSLKGEIEALDIISQGSPSALVIIVLTPIRGTSMKNVKPPSPMSIGRIMTIARLGFSNIPLLLGCARPMGQHKIDTDLFAIKSGANGVAMISQDGVDFAKSKGLEPVFRDVCCSLAFQELS
ncbi:hypothetical protein EU527_04490 [Candidatus Thorarchaeota archaeon]|nr:MAG: hypothetical protein EU527_04490 [Candidatus Thorarchaeota archaeon]